MINEETLLSSNQTLLSILFQVKIIYRYFEDEIFLILNFVDGEKRRDTPMVIPPLKIVKNEKMILR